MRKINSSLSSIDIFLNQSAKKNKENNDFMMIEIKQNELNDNYHRKILQLKDKVWKYGIFMQKKWFEENVKEQDSHFILLNKNEAIAYIMVVPYNVIIDDKMVSIRILSNVCVDPSYRGIGIGKYILDAVVQSMEKEKLVLFTTLKNKMFYEKSGFSLFEGEIICKNSDTSKILMFTKNIEFNIQKIYIEKLI